MSMKKMLLSVSYFLTTGFCGGHANGDDNGNNNSNSTTEAYNHDNVDYYDDIIDEDDEDEMLLRDFDYCNSQQIVELTLRRDYVLLKMQEFVDSETEFDAARALRSIENEGTSNLTNIGMIKFLVRAGMYEIIRDAIRSENRFIIDNVTNKKSLSKDRKDVDDNNDENNTEEEEVKEKACVSNDNNRQPSSCSKNDNDNANASADTSVVRGGLSPSIAKRLFEKLSCYHKEREELRKKKKQSKYYTIIPRVISWNSS